MHTQSTVPAPVHVIYERPRPRIAGGMAALLLAGPIGLIIFAMGQTLWGAVWRAWLAMAIVLGGIYLAFQSPQTSFLVVMLPIVFVLVRIMRSPRRAHR